MSQYITKNKSIRAQNQQRILEQEKIIAFLRTENANLRNIISHIPGHVYWKDKAGIYLGCNNNHAQFLGLSSPNEIIGKHNKDFFNPKLVEKLSQTDEAIITSGNEHFIEELGIDHNHQPAIYLTKKMPLLDENEKPMGLIGASFDISDRKKMEEELKIAKEKAEASSHAKSQFLAVMNHELNTPLASIIGLIGLLRQGGIAPQEKKKILGTIEDCTRHLLKLVNQVLDFSKIEKGTASVHKTPINLSTLLSEVYNFLYLTAKNKGLDLRIHFNHEIQHTIFTDYRILLQILINLVNNAIKFTDKGHITIQISTLALQPHTITLEIAVIDTGIGIPANKLDLIFEPFQQLEDTYTRQSSRQGAGLGLAIVKKLTEQLGMHIKVASTKNQGSIFSLMSEFKTGALNDTAETTFSASVKESVSKKIDNKTNDLMIAAKKPRILIVEDDPVIQYIHRKMLEDFNCHVDIASHGRDVIKILDKHDIVFVDLSLPDINGLEVIKSLRKYTPAKDIPIVALTVHAGKKEKEDCLNAGANKFASKPITKAQLRKILMCYVVKHQVTTADE